MNKVIVLAVLGILIISGCLEQPKEKEGRLAPSPTVTPTPIVTRTPEPIMTPIPTPALIELPPDTLYVTVRMIKPAYWGPGRYELNSLKVEIYNQKEAPITIRAQILSGEQILEERVFSLERAGSSIAFVNEKPYFIQTPDVALRLLIQGYKPKEYKFTEVAELG
jgi:hypothetical protein